jgi:hypothetical protein
MYYLGNVDHDGMVVHLTSSDCEKFEEVIYILHSGWD